MPLFIILFAAGIALLQQQEALPPLAWAATLLPLVLIAWFTRKQRWFFPLVMAVCCITTGYFYAAGRAQLRMNDALPPDWEGRDVQIVGVVASLPQPNERSVRFEFDVERVITTGAVVPVHIALTWWGNPSTDGQRTLAT